MKSLLSQRVVLYKGLGGQIPSEPESIQKIRSFALMFSPGSSTVHHMKNLDNVENLKDRPPLPPGAIPLPPCNLFPGERSTANRKVGAFITERSMTNPELVSRMRRRSQVGSYPQRARESLAISTPH